MKSPHSAPHQAGCRSGLPTRVLPARPCSTLTLQALAARLERVEELLSNVARLHRKELISRWGIHEATFHRWQKAGRIPRPIVFGVTHLWKLTDIQKAEEAGQLPRPKIA